MSEAVTRTLAPFEGLARSQGMDSMQYAGSVLQTAAALHMGAPAQKAQIIAQLINTYGIDVDSVNSAMQGQPQQAQRTPSPIDIRAEVARTLEEERRTRENAENYEAVMAFQASQPEFLDSVQPDMVELLRLDRARGGNMTLQQAYDRACKMNDEVQAVISQRKAADDAKKKAADMAASKAAASSVRSQPASVPAGKPKGLRATLEDAYENLTSR